MPCSYHISLDKSISNLFPSCVSQITMSEDGLMNPSKPIVEYTEDDSVESENAPKMDTSKSDVNTSNVTDTVQDKNETIDTTRPDVNTSSVTETGQDQNETVDTSMRDGNTSAVINKDEEQTNTTNSSGIYGNISAEKDKDETNPNTMDGSSGDQNNNKGNSGEEQLCDDTTLKNNDKPNSEEEEKLIVADVTESENLMQEKTVVKINESDGNDKGESNIEQTVIVAEVHAPENLLDENHASNDESQNNRFHIIGIIKSEDADLDLNEGFLTSTQNTGNEEGKGNAEQKTDDDITIDPVGIDEPSIEGDKVNTDKDTDGIGKIQKIKLRIEQLAASHETDGTVESIDIAKGGNIVPYYGSTDASMNASTVTEKGEQENYNIPDESIEFTEVIDLPECESIETIQEEGVMTEEGKIRLSEIHKLINLSIHI